MDLIEQFNNIQIKRLYTPILSNTVQKLHIGDKIEIYGTILTGRDAALPKLVKSIKNGQDLIDLKGSDNNAHCCKCSRNITHHKQQGRN